MLTKEELATLDRQGYVSLGKLLTDEQVKAINNRVEELLDQEGKNAGSELAESKYIRHPKEAGADRLADLVNKGEVFDVFYTHPRVLAGIAAVLGSSFKLSSLNYRAAKPGQGHQKLHVDWGNTIVDGVYKVCNSIWLLDDFTENNGATRIVPGTHKLGIPPQEKMEGPSLPHPDETIITAPAGSVFIFNSHAWHGGTTNRTSKPRRSVHSYFCTSEQPQQVDQKKYITDETKKRIGTEAQKTLDVL